MSRTAMSDPIPERVQMMMALDKFNTAPGISMSTTTRCTASFNNPFRNGPGYIRVIGRSFEDCVDKAMALVMPLPESEQPQSPREWTVAVLKEGHIMDLCGVVNPNPKRSVETITVREVTEGGGL